MIDDSQRNIQSLERSTSYEAPNNFPNGGEERPTCKRAGEASERRQKGLFQSLASLDLQKKKQGKVQSVIRTEISDWLQRTFVLKEYTNRSK